MAISLWQVHLPHLSSPPTKPINYPNTPTTFKPYALTFTKPTIFTITNHRFSVTVKAGEERQQKPTSEDSQPTQTSLSNEEEQTDLGTEIKKAMMERDITNNNKDDEGFWGGVAAEIGKIEWPAFNKVVGTTGVVLGVIGGSSLVLLTLNAVLAELSDQVFAGRGVQDFFG